MPQPAPGNNRPGGLYLRRMETVRYTHMTPASREVLVLLNPVAGSVSETDALRAAITQRFCAPEWKLHIHETRRGEDTARVVQRAVENEVSLVVAAGGDGTVGAAVNGVAGSPVPLAIIPVGTGNGVAHAMGIPVNRDRALDLAAGSHELAAVDAMRSRGRLWVLNLSSGISARSIRDTRREDKRRFGLLAYAWVIAGHVLGFRSHGYILEIDNRRYLQDATEILVSNGTIMEALPSLIGPRESFCDGAVDVYVINGRSVWDYLEIGFRLLFRRRRYDEKITWYSAQHRVSISTRRGTQAVQGDGEPLGRTPLELEVVPRAFHLVVPAGETEDPRPSGESS